MYYTKIIIVANRCHKEISNNPIKPIRPSRNCQSSKPLRLARNTKTDRVWYGTIPYSHTFIVTNKSAIQRGTTYLRRCRVFAKYTTIVRNSYYELVSSRGSDGAVTNRKLLVSNTPPKFPSSILSSQVTNRSSWQTTTHIFPMNG